MTEQESPVQWQYQLRVTLAGDAARFARENRDHPRLAGLQRILARHDAVLMCQYDLFAGYCAEAEREGIEHYPLYAWTRAVLADPAKREKYLVSFSIHVDGREVYSRSAADAIEAELGPLAGGAVISRLVRHDTNPANNPQMPERYRPDSTPR